MENLKKMIGFEATNSFTLNKSLELVSASGVKTTIEGIPVFVSVGAKFSEVSSGRIADGKNFSFRPYGIICPGEKIIVSDEELRYLIKREMIHILFS